MIFVTSDLHGCDPTVLQKLLKQADFSEADFLFVLGDVIDRGEHGVELLLWLSQQGNVQLILGNHEAMMLSCRFLFQEVSEESLAQLTAEKLMLMRTWQENGGDATMKAMQRLTRQQPELAEGIWDLLLDAPLYDVVRVSGENYLLTHGGLGNFRRDKDLGDYTLEELTMHRPELQERYDPRYRVILGHTPTLLYGSEYQGRAIHTESWSNIDTGAAAGGRPMLLRLEDMQEFYG